MTIPVAELSTFSVITADPHFFFPPSLLLFPPTVVPSTLPWPPPPPIPPNIPANPPPGPPPPPPCAFCISCITSFKIFSLTPPPLSAGECSGSMSLIFHPFGTAGGGMGSCGGGIPWILRRRGDSAVVGWALRCWEIRV